MKKILQINSVINSGATGRFVEDMGNLLVSKGYISYIAYGRGHEKCSKSTYIKIGNLVDVIFHVFVTRFFDMHGFASKNATQKFLKRVDKLSPDIILLNNLHGYYLNLELLFNYIKEKKIPVIWTLFDCWSFTGHCTYFDFSGCEKWKDICHSCINKSNYPGSFFMDRSRTNFIVKKELFSGISDLTLVVHSKWLNSLLAHSFLDDYPREIIYNGVDIDLFKPSSTKDIYSKKKIILGVANQWIRRKGFEDFLKLAKVIPDEFLIFIVGDISKRYRRIPKNIVLLGPIKDMNELCHLYSIADVFVNPTYEDNFPTTNIEALACGTPVISYDSGGSAESFDYQSGIKVKKGDVDHLYQAIVEVLKNGKNAYADYCRERASRYFNKDKQMMHYLKLIENV
jgi:putative colanic acid biosynthesis glycosyltransferase